MVNKFTNNFFIERSSEKIEKEINQLTYLGRQQFFLRDYTSVMAIAEKLLNMSGRANTLGQEFLGRVLSRQSTTREQADALFRNLTSCPDPITRAGAYMHLTSREVLVYQNLDEATYFANKALPLALAHSPLIFAQLQDLLSIVLSLKGDHKGSLKLCQENLKLTRRFSNYHPFIHLNALNSLAIELSEDRQYEYAAHLIKQVSETPYFSLYPEWQETYKEILEAQAAQQRTRIFTGFRDDDQEVEEDECNVVAEEPVLKKVVGSGLISAKTKNIADISEYLDAGSIHESGSLSLTAQGVVRPFRPKSPYIRRLDYNLFIDWVLIDSRNIETPAYSIMLDNYPLENFIGIYEVLDTISQPANVPTIGTIKLILRLVGDSGEIVEQLREDNIYESDLDILFGLFEEMEHWVVQPFFDEHTNMENHWKDLKLTKKVMKMIKD